MQNQKENSDVDQLNNSGSFKVWFITGASRGFGRIWAEAALKRGDKVAATARNLESLTDLKEKYGENVLPLELDVTKADQVNESVKKAHAYFGRLDVICNNAGYTLIGTIEEANQTEIRAQYETNIFGAISVIKAVLPILRQQGSGHILGTSSGVGLVSLPVIGYYCSTKWAFEAIHESLAAEVKPFGINVTLIEPGAYATEFGSPLSAKFAGNIEAYGEFKMQFFEQLQGMERGNPNATSEAIFKIVDTANPPLRFNLGATNLPWVRSVYEERFKVWEDWQDVSAAAQGNVK